MYTTIYKVIQNPASKLIFLKFILIIRIQCKATGTRYVLSANRCNNKRPWLGEAPHYFLNCLFKIILNYSCLSYLTPKSFEYTKGVGKLLVYVHIILYDYSLLSSCRACLKLFTNRIWETFLPVSPNQ
jgi:hypothetical protein